MTSPTRWLPTKPSLRAEHALETDGEDSDQPLRLHEALRAREQLLHRLAEALPLGVLQVDAEGRVVYTNHRLHTILGRARAATAQEQLSMVLSEDKERLDEAFEAVLQGGLDSDIEVRLVTSDDHGSKDVHQCTMSLRALTADTGAVTGAIACVADVTESVRIREELRIRATFDQVTQCHNRASTMDGLEEALTASDQRATPAVIFVDLDRFKDINDRFGHAAGDELLGIVAKRLLRAVREKTWWAESEVTSSWSSAPASPRAPKPCRQRREWPTRFSARFSSRRRVFSCRASIGVAWPAGTGMDADTLVSQADEAMYEAKRRGSGRPILYRSTGNDGPSSGLR